MARQMKIRSEETWRRARAAWEAGETAQSVSVRFDVGYSNLQRRRMAEDWSRAHLVPPDAEPEDDAEASGVRGERVDGLGAGRAPPPPATDPQAAIAQGKARAAALIAEGRGTEARALLMAVEAMARATPEPEPEAGAGAVSSAMNGRHLRGEALRQAGMRALLISLERDATIRSIAVTVAHSMLGDPKTAPVFQLPFVLAWRARHLGPEVAARDRAAAADEGDDDLFWDEAGRLRELLDMDLEMIDRSRQVWRSMWNLPIDDEPWDELEGDAAAEALETAGD